MHGMTLRADPFPVSVELENTVAWMCLKFEYSDAERMLVWAEAFVADLKETIADGPLKVRG